MPAGGGGKDSVTLVARLCQNTRRRIERGKENKRRRNVVTSHIASTMADKAALGQGSSFMDPLKGFLLTYFMPESCYDEFFLKFNLLDGKCLIFVEQ